MTIGTILADDPGAGFDSALNHRDPREEHGITLITPARHGRPRKDGGPPDAPHRRRMYHLLSTRKRRRRCGSTQRQQTETVNSMNKRKGDRRPEPRGYQFQCREMRRLAIIHNIMV